ncbi:FkbM family methyltransferase [Candidatus Kaiserbacteria bacterium]|nr:FkbM family methyltransferase [Candidatus Kaiserbacteria bacterium]
MSKILKKYSPSQIFVYSGVSKVNIFMQLIKYGFHRLIGTRFVETNVNNYRMKLDFKTLGLSKVLYIYGTREIPDTYIAKTEIKPGMVVADIGANIGYYSLIEALAVGETGHVYAFEPDPRNIQLLRDNIALNKMDDRVTVYEQAVSDKKERKTFQLGTRSNVSSFVDRPDVVGAVEVDCIALHEFEHIEEVDMLRMDAEGYECKIIEGVMPYLRSNKKPFKIMLEVHPKEYNDTDLNFKQNLKELFEIGFTVSHVVANKPHRSVYADLGYRPVISYSETRHIRDVYHNISHTDVLNLCDGKVRSIVIVRV